MGVHAAEERGVFGVWGEGEGLLLRLLFVRRCGKAMTAIGDRGGPALLLGVVIVTWQACS